MVTVVLVCTHWTPLFENCRRSLHQQSYKYVVLGWGEKWAGWKWRTKIYLEFLATQNPKDVFLCLDSFDTLAEKPPATLLSTFKSFDKPMVLGAEWYCGSKGNCGEIKNWWLRKKMSAPRNKHINAGFVIGEAETLIKAYAYVFNSTEPDDQKALANWVNEYGQDLAIDSGSALVKNVNFFDGFLSQKNSCFYHFPGPLLKLGLMPMYDALAFRLLGNFARPQISHEGLYSTKIFLQICLFLFSVHILIARLKK